MHTEFLCALPRRKGETGEPWKARQSDGKPGLWEGRHWQLPDNSPVPQQEPLSHIGGRLWLGQAAKYVASAEEFAVSCKPLSAFLLVLDVSFSEKWHKGCNPSKA